MSTVRPRGPVLPGWVPPPRPGRMVLEGRAVRLEPLGQGHADGLHDAFAGHDWLWDYLGVGPFERNGFEAWVAGEAVREDWVWFALVTAAGPEGVAALMRIAPDAGSIEIGGLCLAPSMQRTVAATEMVFLLADWAFRAGYRRVEWKCDALNAPSRRAARRFGFSYEGIFRQATVVKGRSRDTAWFAMTDGDWRAGLRAAFTDWLDPANFDAKGRQRRRLGEMTAPFRVPPAPEAGITPPGG